MVLGIDFGTTKSVACAMSGTKPVPIRDQGGKTRMPSLVMVAPDQRLHVGWEALASPERYESQHFTISSVKRWMGKSQETEWGCYRTCPQEISALILGYLKTLAEVQCETEIHEAVLAVPAHFNINQRWATLQAAEIAGLRVLRLINEATAAVLCDPERWGQEPRTVLVFDFGGGTLDVSVIELGEGLYKVLATRGDDRLGGDDFDQAVVDHLVEELRKTSGSAVSLSRMQELVLREEARRAKVQLSSVSSVRVRIPGFISTGSRSLDLDVELTRGEFESMCSALFGRAEALVRSAMTDAGVDGSRLTDVLLVGGTSRIPQVRELVAKATGRRPYAGVDPEICVAQGAAVYGQFLAGGRDDMGLLDVLPETYSVGVKGGHLHEMIKRNTTIPHSTRGASEHTFTTVVANQTEIRVDVFQGGDSTESQRTFVGTVKLRGVPPAAAGVPRIRVDFDVEVDSTVKVTAEDLGTGKKVVADLEAPYRLNPAQMKVLRRKVGAQVADFLQRQKEHWERGRLEKARGVADALAGQVEAMLAESANMLPPDQVATLCAGRDLIREYLDRDSPRQHLDEITSRVSWSYREAVAACIASEAGALADSPPFQEWVHEAEEALASPSLLATAVDSLAERFKEPIERMARLARKLDAGPDASKYQILSSAAAGPAGSSACLSLVLNRFLGVRIDPRGVACKDGPEGVVWKVRLLDGLRATNPEQDRQRSAEELYRLYRGSECLRLLEYARNEHNETVSHWLDKCFAEMPRGSWARFYVDAPVAERERLRADGVAEHHVCRDLVGLLTDSDSTLAQETVFLEALSEFGAKVYVPQLLRLVEGEPDEERIRATVTALLLRADAEGVLPPGSWSKLYVTASSAWKHWLSSEPSTRGPITCDIVWSIIHGTGSDRVAKLDALNELAPGEHAFELMNLLTEEVADQVKLRVIKQAGASTDERVILPLFRAISDASAAVREAAFAELEKHEPQLDEDTRWLLGKARRVVRGGVRVKWLYRQLMRKFARAHPELAEVARALEAMEPGAASSQAPSDGE